MTLDMYIGQHDALMNIWKAKHHAEQNGFAEDGIVSPERWFALPAEKERIMILLKEAYAKEDAKSEKKLVWNEAKWLAHEPCVKGCGMDCRSCEITGGSFNAVAEWVYGITNARDGELKEYDNWLGARSRKMKEYRAVRDDLLSHIAVVNIKKSSGAKSSDMKDIMSYAEWDKAMNELTGFIFTVKNIHDDAADSLAMPADYLANGIKVVSVGKRLF